MGERGGKRGGARGGSVGGRSTLRAQRLTTLPKRSSSYEKRRRSGRRRTGSYVAGVAAGGCRCMLAVPLPAQMGQETRTRCTSEAFIMIHQGD